MARNIGAANRKNVETGENTGEEGGKKKKAKTGEGEGRKRGGKIGERRKKRRKGRRGGRVRWKRWTRPSLMRTRAIFHRFFQADEGRDRPNGK